MYNFLAWAAALVCGFQHKVKHSERKVIVCGFDRICDGEVTCIYLQICNFENFWWKVSPCRATIIEMERNSNKVFGFELVFWGFVSSKGKAVYHIGCWIIL